MKTTVGKSLVGHSVPAVPCYSRLVCGAHWRWLISWPFVHGWLFVAINIFVYGWTCWIGFWLIRGTGGRERLFLIGWFAGIILWPVKMMAPQWASVIRHVGTFGLAVALFAALALLLEPPDVADAGSQSGGT